MAKVLDNVKENSIILLFILLMFLLALFTGMKERKLNTNQERNNPVILNVE